MQSYRTFPGALMLVMLGIASVACEDHPATPLEPSSEPNLFIEEGGWTTIDGIQYFEHEGVLYPLAGVSAEIWNAKTSGDIWPYGGFVAASFDFRGTGATQSTTWELQQLRDGERLAGATVQNYGGATGGVTTVVRRSYSGSIPIAHPYECDLRLTASTDHSAWWVGVALQPAAPYVVLGKWGVKAAFSKMADRIRECGASDGPIDPGGGDECSGDVCDEPEEGTCTECQEWLYYSASGTYLYNEWECQEISWSTCQALMT